MKSCLISFALSLIISCFQMYTASYILQIVQSDDCLIPEIDHGEVKELILGKYYWNWKVFRYDREKEYVKVPPGTVLRNGSSVTLFCHTHDFVQGASVTNRLITCSKGEWQPDPACPSCTKPAPEIDHGQAEVRSTYHGSVVKYICRDPYILIQNSQVQCSFGEWQGKPPKCEDSRCYLENLYNPAYVDFAATNSITFSGNTLFVSCKEGYSPRSQRPVCLKGKWTENSVSPCKENDCAIPMLNNGDIKEPKMGDYIWNWKTFRYVRETKYEKILPGTIFPYGSSVVLFCHPNYFFQETTVTNKPITCIKGQWYPDPVCLRIGQKYIFRTSTQKPYTTTISITTEQSKSLATPTKMSQISLTAANEVTSEEISKIGVIKTENTQISMTTADETTSKETYETQTTQAEKIQTSQVKSPEVECYCEYPLNDERVIAHSDKKRLKFNDKVQNGTVVTFRCNHVGFYHLDGEKNIKCENCRNWHSSELPICSEPMEARPCVMDDLISVLPENLVPDIDNRNKTVPYNTTVKLTCAEDMIAQGEPVARCNRKGQWDVEITQCISGCPELATDPESSLIVTPRKENYKLGDMVTFSCPPGMTLTTQSQLIMCLKYRWSETILPDCK